MNEIFVSYADHLRAEGERKGEAKGEQRGKAEVVEGLLRVGIGWDVIEAAAGLDEPGYRALKEQIASYS